MDCRRGGVTAGQRSTYAGIHAAAEQDNRALFVFSHNLDAGQNAQVRGQKSVIVEGQPFKAGLRTILPSALDAFQRRIPDELMDLQPQSRRQIVL